MAFFAVRHIQLWPLITMVFCCVLHKITQVLHREVALASYSKSGKLWRVAVAVQGLRDTKTLFTRLRPGHRRQHARAKSDLARLNTLGEIDLRTSVLGQDFTAVHFTALVLGHGFAHGISLPVEHSGEAVEDGLGGGVAHLGAHHKTSRARDQLADP